MSEKHPIHGEHYHTPEILSQPTPEAHKPIEKSAEHKPHVEAKIDEQASRENVNKLAQSKELAPNLSDKSEDHQQTTHFINAEIMKMSYQRALTRVR